MRVAMYYRNDDVRIEKMDKPNIKNDELLVKVHSSGICGSDVMEWYRVKSAPRVLGHEIAGEIVEKGENVEKYDVNDRVFVSHHVPCNTCDFCLSGQHTLCSTLHSTNFYPGGFAEFIRVPSINVDRGVFVLPENMSYDQGTFIEPLACVIRGIRTAGFSSPSSVLIIGCGVAGLLHVKLLKALGATNVIALDINEYRLKKAKETGADFVFNAKSENLVEKIKSCNDGGLADFVSICAGVKDAVLNGLKMVRPGGKILFFAPTSPDVTVDFPLFEMWNKQISFFSTYAGAPVDIKESIEYISSRVISVDDLITHRLPMDKAPEGFKIVSQAEDSVKVIIHPQK
ncbi:MAG: alcohol dehydrogenase catalytic domain-containing protein [Candidatus Thermoplasmatota archaeon]